MLVSDTKNPIEGVQIVNPDSSFNMVINKNGKFHIPADNPDLLIFSHIGYMERIVSISIDHTETVVYMIPATFVIPEFIITEEKYHEFFKDEGFY